MVYVKWFVSSVLRDVWKVICVLSYSTSLLLHVSLVKRYICVVMLVSKKEKRTLIES